MNTAIPTSNIIFVNVFYLLVCKRYISDRELKELIELSLREGL